MADDTISSAELLLFSLDRHFDRIADAAEGIDDLTRQVARLADAFASIAETLNCLTESVEGQDGQSRCTMRTYGISPNVLSMSGGD